MDVAGVLLYAVTLLIVWQMALYPVFCYMVYLLFPQRPPEDFTPFLSVIIPAHNEEKNIMARIENVLEQDYPLMEVIVVESGSTDKTYELAFEAQTKHQNVTIVRENERRGKASAITEAQKIAQGDIIVVTDANALFEKDALRLLARHFSDARVGGVGGRLVVPHMTHDIPLFSAFYWTLEYMMRCGESRLDSACTMHGESSAFRKGIVEPDSSVISEDLDIAVQINRRGLRVEYEAEALVVEKATETSVDMMTQKKRSVIGTILTTRKHATMFLPPKTLYASLIYPSHKVLPVLLPFLFLSIPLLYLYLGLIEIYTHLLIFVSLYIISNLLLLALMPSDGGMKLNLTLGKVLKIFYYFFFQQYIILLGWKDFIFGKYDILWEKVETTR